MKIRHIVAAAALALGTVAAQAAHLEVTDFIGSSGYFSTTINLASGPLSLSAFAENPAETITSFDLLDSNDQVVIPTDYSPDSFGYGLEFASLAYGTYSLRVGALIGSRVTITADTNGAWGTPSTPVPEPEAYAMAFAGLGVMGLLARRRKAA